MCACPRACAYAKKWWNDFRSVFGVVSINVADRLATSWDPLGLQVQSYQLLFTGGWF